MAKDPTELRRLLLEAVDRVYDQVLRRNWGVETPSPGKLIREGLFIARKSIEEVPLNAPSYLDAVLSALKDARDRQDACGISLDGWRDEDGYILSGIRDACLEAEKLKSEAVPLAADTILPHHDRLTAEASSRQGSSSGKSIPLPLPPVPRS